LETFIGSPYLPGKVLNILDYLDRRGPKLEGRKGIKDFQRGQNWPTLGRKERGKASFE